MTRTNEDWQCERSKVFLRVFVSPDILKLASIRGKMKFALITLASAMTVSGSSIWTHSNPVSYDNYSILEVSFVKRVVDSGWTQTKMFFEVFHFGADFFLHN